MMKTEQSPAPPTVTSFIISTGPTGVTMRVRCRNHAPLVAVPYRIGAASRSVGVAGSDKQIVQFGVRLAASVSAAGTP